MARRIRAGRVSFVGMWRLTALNVDALHAGNGTALASLRATPRHFATGARSVRHEARCTASIYWVAMPSGQAMPVDVAPDAGGGFVVTVRPGTGQLRAEAFLASEHGGARNRYTSHFATCPSAAAHRKAST